MAAPGRISATGDGGSPNTPNSQSEETPKHLPPAPDGGHRACECIKSPIVHAPSLLVGKKSGIAYVLRTPRVWLVTGAYANGPSILSASGVPSSSSAS